MMMAREIEDRDSNYTHIPHYQGYHPLHRTRVLFHLFHEPCPVSFSPVAGALPEDFHGSTVIYNRPILPSDVVDGGVAIAVFERETSKGSMNSSEPTRKLCVFPSLASSTSMCV